MPQQSTAATLRSGNVLRAETRGVRSNGLRVRAPQVRVIQSGHGVVCMVGEHRLYLMALSFDIARLRNPHS